MQRVSSNLTLALVLFVPVFWTTFFGAFTLAIWVYRFDYYGSVPGIVLRLGMTAFLVAGLLFFYFTVLRLKRVEIDEQFLYVTNYFKHVRYPFHQVASIKVTDWRLFRTVSIQLRTKGSFGSSVVFIPTGRVFEEFVENHPDLSKKRQSNPAV